MRTISSVLAGLVFMATAATTATLAQSNAPAEHFTAFAVNCTHLACPVNWQAQAQLFLCPCHGGVF